MTTIQITLDDRETQAISRMAQLAGKTPEAWLKELASRQAPPAPNKDWIEKFVESARHNPGNSHGWKWNRAELYDE